VVTLTFCYNLWYVPISIAFEYQITEPGFFLLDALAILVYVLDMPYKLHKASINEYGHIERNLHRIQEGYLRHGLFTDLIASLPLDYLAITSPQWVGAWLRLLRLVKVIEIH
jgi:hypothetical protein